MCRCVFGGGNIARAGRVVGRGGGVLRRGMLCEGEKRVDGSGEREREREREAMSKISSSPDIPRLLMHKGNPTPALS